MKEIEKFKFSKFLIRYLQETLGQKVYNYKHNKTSELEFPRSSSPCPNAEVCGSCPLSHIPYNLQLAIKKDYVLGLLKLAKVSGDVLKNIIIIPSVPDSHYRNRMDFAVDIDGNLGLKEKGSWYTIIPHHKCFLSVPSIERAFDLVEEAFKKFDVKGYDRKSHKGFLSFVVIRGNLQGEVSINYILRKDIIIKLLTMDEQLFMNYMHTLGRATRYIVGLAKKYSIKVLGGALAVTNSLREESTGDVVFTYGHDHGKALSLAQVSPDAFPDYINGVKLNFEKGLLNLALGFNNLEPNYNVDASDPLTLKDQVKITTEIDSYLPVVPVVSHGVTYNILPFSFFQPNLYTAGILQQLVGFYATFRDKNKTYFDKNRHVLDLFGGQGFLGGFLAYHLSTNVDVIEVDEDAINYGVRIWKQYVPYTEAMDIQGLLLNQHGRHKERNHYGLSPKTSTFRLVHADAYDIEIPDIYDVIILDPPRRGLTKKLAKRLLKLKHVQRIVYVSCNIKQFVMEYSKHLSDLFVLRHVILLDQFPHTEHIEAVVTLDRKD